MRGVVVVGGTPTGDTRTHRHLDHPGRPGNRSLIWHGHPIVPTGERLVLPWGTGPVEQGEEERARAKGSAPGRKVTRPASVAG